MFSQTQYRAIAQVFANRLDQLGPYTEDSIFGEVASQLETTAGDLATMFEADNPRFKRDVFMAAAGFMDTTEVEAALRVVPEPEPAEEPDDDPLDFDASYRVDGYPGVAWRLLRHPVITPECEGHADGDNGMPSDNGIGQTWYCDGSCRSEEADESAVIAVMIGDDREHWIDVDDVHRLDESAFCEECGQIGCVHGIGTYTETDREEARAEARAAIDARDDS